MPNDLAIILVSALLAMAIVLARLLFDRLERIATSRRRKAQRMAQVRASRLPADDAVWERANPTSSPIAPATPPLAPAPVSPAPVLAPSPEPAPAPVPVLAVAPPPVVVHALAESDGWQTQPIVPIAPAPSDASPMPSDPSPQPVAPSVPQEPAAWRLHPATASAGFAASSPGGSRPGHPSRSL